MLCTVSCVRRKRSPLKKMRHCYDCFRLMCLADCHRLARTASDERCFNSSVMIFFVVSLRCLTMRLPAGAYATWFTTEDPSLLMGVISYVVTALSEPSLCFPAANALKELCDANRTALAPHISAFGSLHAGIASIPASLIHMI